MKDDTISRAAAIDALRTCYDTKTISMDNGDEYINYDDAVGEIEQLPSTQPEQKKGKWIDDTYCSKCGWVHITDAGFIGSVDGFNFCPNCGADMRGDKDAVD